MTDVTVTIDYRVKKPSKSWKFGTIFLDTKYRKVYMLSLISYTQACLIGLSDGNRFSDPIKFSETGEYGIDADDLIKITDNQVDRFVEIENVQIKAW